MCLSGDSLLFDDQDSDGLAHPVRRMGRTGAGRSQHCSEGRTPSHANVQLLPFFPEDAGAAAEPPPPSAV